MRNVLLLCAAVVAAVTIGCNDGGEPAPTPAPSPLAGGADPELPRVPQPAVREDDPPPPEEAPASEYAWLFPDLEALPIREMFIESSDAGRVLRFSTTVANSGDGPLELKGAVAGDTVTATQRVYAQDGTIGERVAGRFVFHNAHAHWHFVDFTILEIWTLDESGQPAEIVASTGKATFCAVDELQLVEDSAPAAYFECGGDVQGISAGWTDTYGAEISGQELDITNLADGRYAVRSTVDPAGRLQELDEGNNSVTDIIEIEGTEIRFLDS